MTVCRILVAESGGFAPRAAETLRSLGQVTLADLDRGRLIAAVQDADVLWVRLRHRIDVEVMRASPRLRIIVTPTTGLNHIDLEEAERRGIQILSLRGEIGFLKDVVATAEHTLALILALLRHVPAAAHHVTSGGWNREQFKGVEIRGKTIGVVGYGRLGRIVTGYLTALGAKVVVADPVLEPRELPPAVVGERLAELLTSADLVTLHVNLGADTAGFFGKQQFAAMKRGAWFVNTARGELIDEHALLSALETGHIAGAALDVLTDETSNGMGDRAIVRYARDHENLIITPHIAGCTAESMEKTELFLAERLRDSLGATQPGSGNHPGAGGGITCAE